MHEKKLTVIRTAANLRYSPIEIFRGEDGDIVWNDPPVGSAREPGLNNGAIVNGVRIGHECYIFLGLYVGLESLFKAYEDGLDVRQFLRDLDKYHGASELGRQAFWDESLEQLRREKSESAMQSVAQEFDGAQPTRSEPSRKMGMML